MSEKTERLEAELVLAKLEDKFTAAKEKGLAPPKLKLEVRAARQKFREKYREQVNVEPATVGMSATVKEV